MSDTKQNPAHPLVIDSVTKLCRPATQDDISQFERIAVKYAHMLRTLKELTHAD